MSPKIDREAFTAAYNTGMSREELAHHFGVKPKTISKWRNQYGLPTWRTDVDRQVFRAAHAEGLHRDQLAERFNVTPNAVTKIRNQLGLPHDPSRAVPPTPYRVKIDRDQIAQLTEQGLSREAIAERIGCHPDTISRARRELGIANNYRGRPMTPERKAKIQKMIDDGWSHAEIERTEGADHSTLARHFPGTAWTHQQSGEHQAALRILNPHHFNARPRTYDRAKYERAA